MSRASKPNPKHGSVQPFNPPKLSDKLILILQDYLGVSDAKMRTATIEIEMRLGMYRAELISLDKKPSIASIKAEIEPVFKLVNNLFESLERLTPSTLGAIYEKNASKLENGNPIDDAMLYLARFGEVLKPVLFDNSKESRGGTNRLAARKILLSTLEKVYADYSVRVNDNDKYDFILEIMEDQNIPEMDIRKIKQLLED